MMKNSSVLKLLLCLSTLFCFLDIVPATTRSKKPQDSISYAALILLNDQGQILLLRRSGDVFGSGQYGLPGGKIDSGETALEGAMREVQEEVGVQVIAPEFVHVVNKQGAQTEFYIFIFQARAWQGVVRNCEEHKCDDMRWVSLDALPENILPAHRQALELSTRGVRYSEHGWH